LTVGSLKKNNKETKYTSLLKIGVKKLVFSTFSKWLFFLSLPTLAAEHASKDSLTSQLL
jgi:hypothetical protein